MKKATFLKRMSVAAAISVTAMMFTGLNAATPQKTTVKTTTVPKTVTTPKKPVVKTEVTTSSVYKRAEVITSAEEAKKLLIEGNKRFTQGTPAVKDTGKDKRAKLAKEGQKPFAVIVSCSDSRVPAELVFDQALGDIFVIRDAGNVVDPVTLGSIEYGAEHLNAPLIIVLGHEKCGAVKATVDGGNVSDNIKTIIDQIKPSLEKAQKDTASKEDIYEKTADENIENTVAKIKESPVIKKLEEEKKVTVIGAKYHLETGEVTFDAEK